jgi:L-lactate dehydrogenase complex protein LldG
MNTSRDVILARVRSALADVPDLPIEMDTPVEWEWAQPTPMDDVLAVFIDALDDYGAEVKRVPKADIPKAVVELLKGRGAKSAVLPSGLDASWVKAIKAAHIETHSDEPRLSNTELNDIAAVVTASRVGIAATGTIVLDHTANQGRRALSLVPDIHACVVLAEDVVSDVPEAVARLKPSVLDGQPLTWISGGSATSDIELQRVPGVHGPRQLLVVLAE